MRYDDLTGSDDGRIEFDSNRFPLEPLGSHFSRPAENQNTKRGRPSACGKGLYPSFGPL
jgi:hypothetical protein